MCHVVFQGTPFCVVFQGKPTGNPPVLERGPAPLTTDTPVGQNLRYQKWAWLLLVAVSFMCVCVCVEYVLRLYGRSQG